MKIKLKEKMNLESEIPNELSMALPNPIVVDAAAVAVSTDSNEASPGSDKNHNLGNSNRFSSNDTLEPEGTINKKGSDLDDDDDGFKLPEVDWDGLEAKLKEAQIEMNNQRSVYQNTERDEIRRKLAIVSSSSSSTSASSFNESHSYKNHHSVTAKTNYLGQNLQICFMNELPNDEFDDETLDTQETTEKSGKHKKKLANHIANLPVFSFKENSTCDDLLAQHLKLQNETREALINVQANVKEQPKVEETVIKKASPIADIVGLDTYGLERLTRGHIVNMNIGQLQVIANDLCNQIENTNENLQVMLTERDDIYMQQDSYLVDIEDVSKRIQEYAALIKCNSNDAISSRGQSTSSGPAKDKLQSNSGMNTHSFLNHKSRLSQLNNILAAKIYQFAKKN